MTVFIGGAWPYANGSLHLGHVAALLPGDILARYYRMKGEDVLYVSGSDCNGTPIGIRASQEGVPVEAIADRFHREFKETFDSLGFSYDLYTRTDKQPHHEAVQEIFRTLHRNGWLYEKEVEQAYCEVDQRFLPDRFVEGICPVCGAKARGDQCDHCSTVLDPLDLKDRTCKLCQTEPVIKSTTHLYFALSEFQDALEEWVKDHGGDWRENALNLTQRYLNEGLHDRAVTRDLENGVAVPVQGFEDKKVYVWIEAVSGYYSASKEWGVETGKDWKRFWEEDTRTYYVHGKDNIPFHTIIWPAVMKGIGVEALPHHVVSNEYLTLEKKKFSTSGNWAVWARNLLDRYEPDSLRYFLTINAPEKRDADFSWREFIHSHNGELLGAFGNLVQRTLKFYRKAYGEKVEFASVGRELREEVQNQFDLAGKRIEEGTTREALDGIFAYIRGINKRFDESKPWVVVKEDENRGKELLTGFIYIIANLRALLNPFLPEKAEQLGRQLGSDIAMWGPVQSDVLHLQEGGPLFERIDPTVIEEEVEKLIAESSNP